MMAARDGSIPLLQRALNVKAMSAAVSKEINKAVISGPSQSEITAVHLAASRGHASVLEWLLQRGGEVGPSSQVDKGKSGSKKTKTNSPHPLHLAAAHGHLQALEVLAAKRADLSSRAGAGRS